MSLNKTGSVLAGLVLSLFGENSLAQDWHKHNVPLDIHIDLEDMPTQMRYFINDVEVSNLVTRVNKNTWRYDSALLPLPSGEVNLTVYDVSNGDWQEIKNQQLYILSPHGFERSVFHTSANLGIDSRWDAGAKGDGNEPERKRVHNANLQVSLGTEHKKGNFSINSSANIMGVDKEENALRYGQKANAPRVDLSDYVVSVSKGNLDIALGHVNFHGNPLLMTDLAHRGISGTWKINPFLELGVTQQSGSAIVGWDNLFGLEDSRHRISASTLALELLPSDPGKLRIEYTLLQGKKQSLNDFGAGQVSDVERNSGWGLSFAGHWFESRLRANAVYAESRFDNPFDAALLAGDEFSETDLVRVKASTDTAWQYTIAFDLFTGEDDSPSPYFTSVSWQGARADAQYRALAASPDADTINSKFAAQGKFYDFTWEYSQQKSENNVDNIPSILKTRTDSQQTLAQWNTASTFSEGEEVGPFVWWPQLVLNVQNVHQYALNSPDADISDFNGGSHLPDQNNELLDFAVSWNPGGHSIGYNYSGTHQDNRQTGRELADFKRRSHNLSVALSFFSALNINASYGRARNIDREQAEVFYNRVGNIGVSANIGAGWNIDGSYSLNRDFTSLGSSSSDAKSVSLGVSQNWQLREVNGQWNLRYARQKNTSLDNVFGFSTLAEEWSVTSGFSVNF